MLLKDRQLLQCHLSQNPLQVMVQSTENGILVLLGSLYFPLLPVIGLIGNLVTFYTRLSLSCFINDVPKVRTSGLQDSNFNYFLFAGKLVHALVSTSILCLTYA